MKENIIKKALRQGKVVTGMMVSESKTTMLGRILDAASVQFAIIDMEHGAYSTDSLPSIINGFYGVDCVPFVRVPCIRREYFLTPLELGALGLLVPRVENKEDAERCVYFSKYSPEGDRGVSSRGPHTLFRRVNIHDYMPYANENLLIMVQIESATALENLDEILAVDGIDVAFIGPSDLCQSLKLKGGVNSPEMKNIVSQVVSCAQKHGKAAGIHIYDAVLAAEFIEKGMQFISCNTDVNALIGAMSYSINQIFEESKQKNLFFRNSSKN